MQSIITRFLNCERFEFRIIKRFALRSDPEIADSFVTERNKTFFFDGFRNWVLLGGCLLKRRTWLEYAISTKTEQGRRLHPWTLVATDAAREIGGASSDWLDWLLYLWEHQSKSSVYVSGGTLSKQVASYCAELTTGQVQEDVIPKMEYVCIDDPGGTSATLFEKLWTEKNEKQPINNGQRRNDREQIDTLEMIGNTKTTDDLDTIEESINGQKLRLFRFLRSKKHWTGYETLAAIEGVWREADVSDDAIVKAVKRLNESLLESAYTIEIKDRRVKLVCLTIDK
jgi:hypothetical protein